MGRRLNLVCGCHGLPTVWKTDRRRRAGGYYRCRVAVAHDNRGRERQLAYWHKTGYYRRRRRHLEAQRQQVRHLLLELEQEAMSLARS